MENDKIDIGGGVHARIGPDGSPDGTIEVISCDVKRDDEYEVVEVSEFDDLRVGDVLDNTNETDIEIRDELAFLSGLSNATLIRHDFARFDMLKIRRGKKKCVVECELVEFDFKGRKPWLGGSLTIDELTKAGFKPGNKVRVTVEGM